MEKCPNCGAELETDYDANEDPYLFCPSPGCNWCAPEEEVDD